MRFMLLFILLIFGLTQSAAAGEVKLAWNAVKDARVHHYQIHTGSASGKYNRQLNTSATSLMIGELESGETYYFAARACNQDETTCSDLIQRNHRRYPLHAVPVARLSANAVSGIAPLPVNFSDNSTGVITSRDLELWRWRHQHGDRSDAHLYHARHLSGESDRERPRRHERRFPRGLHQGQVPSAGGRVCRHGRRRHRAA